MDDVRQIGFAEVLSLLHGLIGQRFQVAVSLSGYFLDCGFTAVLERVLTMSADEGPLLVVFGHTNTIALDPSAVRWFIPAGRQVAGGAWLELQVDDRARVVIESIPRGSR